MQSDAESVAVGQECSDRYFGNGNNIAESGKVIVYPYNAVERKWSTNST